MGFNESGSRDRSSTRTDQKDWGFSVSNGQLVVLAGSDPLSDDELTTLKVALADLTSPANTVAETTVRMIELERRQDEFVFSFDVRGPAARRAQALMQVGVLEGVHRVRHAE